MATKQITPVAEFVKLGYGDSHDLSVRCLDFRTEGIGDFDTAAECLRVIDRYNGFDAERIIPALEHVWPAISSVQIGREYSPVIYAKIPHWTNQRNDWEGGGMGESHDSDTMAAIALAFLGAMAGADADELSVVTPKGHVFFETHDSRLVRGSQTIAAMEEKPYKLRVWWD